jgi:hypothetical protein
MIMISVAQQMSTLICRFQHTLHLVRYTTRTEGRGVRTEGSRCRSTQSSVLRPRNLVGAFTPES